MKIKKRDWISGAIGVGTGILLTGATYGLIQKYRSKSENMIGKINQSLSKHNYAPFKNGLLPQQRKSIFLTSSKTSVSNELLATNDIENGYLTLPKASMTKMRISHDGKSFILPAVKDDGVAKRSLYTMDLQQYAQNSSKMMKNLVKGGFMGDSICVIDRFSHVGNQYSSFAIIFKENVPVLVSASAFYLIEQCKKRFVAIPIVQAWSGQAHATIMLIDKHEKTVQIIDSNGQWIYDTTYEHVERQITTQIMTKLGLSDYKLLQMQETCPRFINYEGNIKELKRWPGVQQRLSKDLPMDTIGSCWLWTILFACVKGLNPERTTTEIRDAMASLNSESAYQITTYMTAVIEYAIEMD